MRILAISPTSRKIGIAVFEGTRLLDWHTANFPHAWSDQKLQMMLSCIGKYIVPETEAVVIKIPDMLPTSENYIKLVGTINVLLENRRIKPVYITLSEAKAWYSGNKRISKTKIWDRITERFPEMLPEYTHEQQNKRVYYANMLEAVAIGYYYLKESN